jgi:hypothetical protein
MTINNPNRTERQTVDQRLIDGINRHTQTVSSLIIGGTTFTTTDIIGILQLRIVVASTAVSTKATWQTAVKADQDEHAKTKTFVSGLRQALTVMFAGQIDALADFGLKPRKVRVTTPEQKAEAAAKARATRAARHTMGPKQKALVKGTVPAPTTPPTPTLPTALRAPEAVDPPGAGPVPAATARHS